MRQWVKWVGGGITLLALAGVLWEPLVAEENAPLPNRAYDVEIVRDKFGVPHINGKTDADASYGLAYAHAEDDFATIQEVVAMTRGRTGAMTGSDGAKVDYAMHLLGARDTAERDYAAIPADVRAAAEGYAAGLNLYAEKHPGEVRLSKLFPVNGQDIVTGFVLRAPFFYGIDSVIGNLVGNKPLRGETAAAMTPAGRNPDQNGSNAFAVAPKRMADGKTWLISNSHQPYEGNVAWYETVMHSGEGLDMAGALFPGSPFVLLGHNRNLGWTNTVNRPDLVDVYKLVLSEKGDQYRLDGAWKPLTSERVWLPIKFGPFTIPVPKNLYRSVHGPVIKNKAGAFAIRYAGIDSSKALEQYYRNTKAQNWDEWSRSMALGGVPGTNFIYADKSGRIAFIYNALFPDRKPGYDYTKILPGDISANLWAGPVGYDRYPKLIDPPSGFLQNANNSPFLAAGPGSEMKPSDYSPLLGIELGMTNRGLRATELLAADSSITPEELLAIKFDTVYSKASFVGEWMKRIAAADFSKVPDLAAAQKLLSTWDWSSDGKGKADAFAERVIRFAARTQHQRAPLPEVHETMRAAVDDLMKRFGRIDPPLMEVQRLRMGRVDLPMDGGTDTLRATSIWDFDQRDGKYRTKHGDSFTMLINWDKAGKVWSQSVQPYGSATTRPNSPHFSDQMKLFAEHRFKPVHFEWAEAVAQGGKVYRPGQSLQMNGTGAD